MRNKKINNRVDKKYLGLLTALRIVLVQGPSETCESKDIKREDEESSSTSSPKNWVGAVDLVGKTGVETFSKK